MDKIIIMANHTHIIQLANLKTSRHTPVFYDYFSEEAIYKNDIITLSAKYFGNYARIGHLGTVFIQSTNEIFGKIIKIINIKNKNIIYQEQFDKEMFSKEIPKNLWNNNIFPIKGNY